MPIKIRSSFTLAALCLVGCSTVAFAQQDQGSDQVGAPPIPDNPSTPAQAAAVPSIQSSLGKYGDPGGIRAYLDSKGIDYAFTYIGEVLGNPTGGVKQGGTYEGRLDGTLDIDLEKLANVTGLSAHAEFYQIHGRGLSGNNLQNLLTVSYIEAYPSTKLYEAWFEEKLANGSLFLRAGQLAADTEFMISSTAQTLINSSFGWPGSFGADLPSGGPAYPLGAPAVRVKYTPNDHLTVLAALFDGDPAGPYEPGLNNPLAQVRDYSGTNFRIDDPPLLITEAQFSYDQGDKTGKLPGTLKIGYYHHFEEFAALDVPLGATINDRGDDAAYFVLDQAVYRKPGTDDQGASIFVRGTVSPADRNVVDIYFDGGVGYKGLIPGRTDDTAAVGIAYARISPDLALAQAQAGAFPVQDYEAVVEATYQAQVVPGFTLQPDFQYVFHPGAHGIVIPGTNLPTNDAAVFALRATVHY